MKNDLNQHLSMVLRELDQLTIQIRKTQDYSESAEYILTLREMVLEQMKGISEDSNHSDHQVR